MSRAPRQLWHYLGGRAVGGVSGRLHDVYDPSIGSVVAQAPLASRAEAVGAVVEAQRAFPAWAATAPQARARVLFRWRELLERERTALGDLISREHGKVASDAAGELQRGLEVVEFACGMPHLLKGEHSAGVGRDIDMWSERLPLGVVAAITPFNFPAMVPLWMVAPALACGNTVILKPSEKVPSCALRLAELFTEAGGPPGVLNVLLGDAEAVQVLLTDPSVQAVSFVGSTPIARQVYATAAGHGKRVQAMGGAKNHAVILPDADLDRAADALMGAAFGSAGERCMAISVAVAVGEATADALVARLAERVRALRIGPAARDLDLGPLVTAAHRDRVADYVRIGAEEGATLVVDGRGVRVDGHADGFWLGGCLFDRVTTEMRIWQEEIFGPVLCVMRAQDAEAALRIVNECEFGNGAAVFTRDGAAARAFAARVQAGMVGINVAIPVPLAFHTFGGWKASAFGDLNQHGPDGVRFFTKLRTVTARWPDADAGGAGFAMPTLG
jgi:malonate-semialdehyde dehydrogenase (acetylating)/methylmalonate-semialdehyde dehydrogenase